VGGLVINCGALGAGAFERSWGDWVLMFEFLRGECCTIPV